MFHESNPAAATAAAASTACPDPWRRPSPSSTWGWVDCTPSEIRVTPAAR